MKQLFVDGVEIDLFMPTRRAGARSTWAAHRPAHCLCPRRPTKDPEPLYQFLKRDQHNNVAGKDYKEFLKGQKMPGESYGWAYSFDQKTKWHQISTTRARYLRTICAGS